MMDKTKDYFKVINLKTLIRVNNNLYNKIFMVLICLPKILLFLKPNNRLLIILT